MEIIKNTLFMCGSKFEKGRIHEGDQNYILQYHATQ